MTPKWYEDKRYINIRGLFGLTLDEREAWEIVLARTMDQLNRRKFIGVKVYTKTKQKCQYGKLNYHYIGDCESNGKVSFIFKYGNKYYSIFLCEFHFRHYMDELLTKLVSTVSEYTNTMKRWVSQWI